MRQTAESVHGYDEAKFRSQGTTPTHVIYSRISSFDSFFRTIIQIVLNPISQSQIRVEGKETEKDVFNAAMRIVVAVLLLAPDLTPTLVQPETISLLFALATRCENKADLERVDDKIMFYLQQSG